jgi:hypothetical protein
MKEKDRITKGIKERKKEDEGLRYEKNHSPLNFNGLSSHWFITMYLIFEWS